MKVTMTTLCYLEKDNQYLMLLRNKKENDLNAGKWIGVGGKFEFGESPEECMKREVLEETGYVADAYRYRGLVTFVSEGIETEYMHLFTIHEFHGTPIECKEGTLRWVPIPEVMSLNLWEGDKIFLKLLQENKENFSLKLVYRKDELVHVVQYR